MQHRRPPRPRPATASAASSVNGPGNTDTARNTRRSLLIEQLVAPLHGGRQRPLPRRRQPVPAGQQREPVIEAVQQLPHPQRLHPRRRQLDRQRHPVQPRHQPRHPGSGLLIEREMRVGAAGPVGEQRHRLRPAAPLSGVRAGQGQRPQPVPRLPGHRQRLPAGRQHPHVITGRQQPGAQLRGRADHVLAVIQHQQQLLPGQHPRHRLGRRDTGLLAHPQRRRHHRRRPAPGPAPAPAPPATPRPRTGPPPPGPPGRPAGSSPPRPARSPSPAGAPPAGPRPRAAARPGR